MANPSYKTVPVAWGGLQTLVGYLTTVSNFGTVVLFFEEAAGQSRYTSCRKWKWCLPSLPP